MIKIMIVSIIGVFFFLGCAGIGELKVVHNPEFNKVTKVEVGDNMYQKEYAYFSHDKDIKLLEEGCIKKLNVCFNPITDDEIVLTTTKTGENTGYIQGFNLIDTNNTGYFTHADNSILPGAYSVRYLLDKPVSYRIIHAKGVNYGGEGYSKIALYQGKIGNKINVSFREFINDFARPAFTQDIEYELDSNGSTVIGFKGLRINVIKATNVDIEYSVIQGYSQ